MELEERCVNDPHMLAADGKHFYSPCFRIILDEMDSSEPLGVKQKDLQAIDSFNKLQQQVDNFLAAEERAMEKRIRTFIKEQQEAFNIVKSRANKDRAILWRKLCKINSSYSSTQNVAPVSHPQSTPPSSPFKVASSAPSSIAPISNITFSSNIPTKRLEEKVSTSSTAVSTDKGWQPAELAKQLAPKRNHLINSSADGGIFAFDDDDQESAPVQLATYQEDPLSDEEDPPTTDTTKFLATSLPIHILNPLMSMGGVPMNNFRPPPREVITRSLQVPVELELDIAKVPRESWSSRSEIGEELPAEVAASFAVPLSLNRRIKSLI